MLGFGDALMNVNRLMGRHIGGSSITLGHHGTILFMNVMLAPRFHGVVIHFLPLQYTVACPPRDAFVAEQKKCGLTSAKLPRTFFCHSGAVAAIHGDDSTFAFPHNSACMTNPLGGLVA